MTLRIGSRGSALARWQADHVQRRLREAHPGLDPVVHILRTTGDRIRDVPLARIGDKGLFTKEIDRALLTGAVDLAVHSLKDVPTRSEDGLALATVLEREDPRDVFLPAPDRPASIEALPAGARVGTSSLRRRAQLLHTRPDLEVRDLRGNLDTRIGKLHDGEYDGAILARAGIRRLEREEVIGEVLDAPGWLPAVGQGALAIMIREDDEETRDVLAPLDDPDTRATITAERRFLRVLEGGCQIPIGALARLEKGTLRLRGFVASLDGTSFLRGEAEGPVETAAEIGERLAEELVGRGAGEILDEVRRQSEQTLPNASAP